MGVGKADIGDVGIDRDAPVERRSTMVSDTVVTLSTAMVFKQGKRVEVDILLNTSLVAPTSPSRKNVGRASNCTPCNQ